MGVWRLFYLGLLAGLLSRAPGFDVGTLIFALSLNQLLFNCKLLESFQRCGLAVAGFAITLFFPLWKLEILYYIHADLVLSFFFGLVFMGALFQWVKAVGQNELIKKMLISSVLLVLLVYLKTIQGNWVIQANFMTKILSSFLLLIPGLEFSVTPRVGFEYLSMLLVLCGVSLSVLLLHTLTHKSKSYWSFIRVPFILCSLWSLWPYRSFQHYVYLGEGVKWLRDYPMPIPSWELRNGLCLILMLLGALMSWSVLATKASRAVLED